MVTAEMLIKIEEQLNLLGALSLLASPASVRNTDENLPPTVSNILNELKNNADTSFFEDLEELIRRNKAYVKENGNTDFAKFYNAARITAATWSNLKIWSIDGNAAKSSKETLRKIVIALKLNVDQANALLNKACDCLTMADYRDSIIIACIKLGYNSCEDVYEILENPIFKKDDLGRDRYKNIY